MNELTYLHPTDGVESLLMRDWSVGPQFIIVIADENFTDSFSDELDSVPPDEAIFGLINISKFSPFEFRRSDDDRVTALDPLLGVLGKLNSPRNTAVTLAAKPIALDEVVHDRPLTADEISGLFEAEVKKNIPGTREHTLHALTEGIKPVEPDAHAVNPKQQVFDAMPAVMYTELMHLLFDRGASVGYAHIFKHMLEEMKPLNGQHLKVEIYADDAKIGLKTGAKMSLPYATRGYSNRGASPVNIAIRTENEFDVLAEGHPTDVIVTPDRTPTGKTLLLFDVDRGVLQQVDGDISKFPYIKPLIERLGFSFMY
jgi:hypothetical protein